MARPATQKQRRRLKRFGHSRSNSQANKTDQIGIV